MTRWHSPSCQSPIVWVGEDSVPRCNACGASAHEQLQQLREHPSNPVSPLPPDEKAGQLNLYWPPTVPYTRRETAASTEDIHDSPQISNTPSRTQRSLIHGRTLAKDEFRLIYLTAEEKYLPEDVVHLSLETYNDGNFPDYEAASYTWGGEDGDDTLRHPVYIGEHWDVLLQTRNCCAMLRYLRPSRGMRMVWVDVICINQEDMQERGDQITKMGQIFTGCFQVFLWLGDDIVFKKPGVHPPRLPLHELESLEELQLPTKTEPVNIRSLFERRYFSRVWIIQELILPPRIVIPIGEKIFWVDPLTATHFERLKGSGWRWGETRAPWFQHATRGSVMQEDLSESLALTWKSQSSDIRDKVYGVLGLSSVKEIIKIRPNYGISLQHLLIGSLAHCIINGGTPELLLKAAGVSAEAGMPSWMPRWKGDAWEELFWIKWEADLGMQNLMDSLIKERIKSSQHGLRKKITTMRSFLNNYPVHESDIRKAVFEKRPWHKDAIVDADTGAMSLNLTRLVRIKYRPVRADAVEKGCYLIDNVKGSEDCICITSQSDLEKVVEVGDDIFLLETKNHTRAPIYLIMRKTDNPREFHLIAACHRLALFFWTFVAQPDRKPRFLRLNDLQESLHADFMRLRGYYDCEMSRFIGGTQSTQMRMLFPGRRGPVTFKEVLPLLLGIERNERKHKFKSWKSFQELYLEFIDPKFQPRVSNNCCELSLDAEDEEEINNLVGCYADGFTGMDGWTKEPDKEGVGRVVLRRSMRLIAYELRTVVSLLNRTGTSRFDPVMLLNNLVDRLEDVDVGERIMAGPVEEDHFRGGTNYGRDRVFEKFQLDGSTFRVRIV